MSATSKYYFPKIMEQLKSTTTDISLQGKTYHCTLQEKDFGDYIVYDVYTGGNYIATLSKQGDVLFNKEAISDPQIIMEPPLLNDLLDHLRDKISSGALV
jgi:hypothetical protein